nr:hypothetical protein [Macrococcus goetzii]
MKRRYMHYKFFVPKRTYLNEPETPKMFINTKVKSREWDFTGCKNERWLKFIEERVTFR